MLAAVARSWPASAPARCQAGGMKLLLCLVVTMSACVVSAMAAETLLPSVALRATLAEVANDRTRQREIAESYLARVRPDEPHGEAEQFALAELYFVALKPDEARAAFRPFLDGDDLRARMAWQRLMQMSAVAYGDFERVERLITEYRAKFSPDMRDPYHTFSGTRALAAHFKGQGNHAKVVELILAELAALPSSHPRYAAGLARSNHESFAVIGRTAEAVEILRRHKATLEKLEAEGYTGWPSDELPRIEEMPSSGAFFQRVLGAYRQPPTAAPSAPAPRLN